MKKMQVLNAITRCQERLANHDFTGTKCKCGFVIEDLLTKGDITYSLISHHAVMMELHARHKNEEPGDLICAFKLNFISHELTAELIAKILREA